MSVLTLEEQRLIAGCKKNESWAIKKLRLKDRWP
jgi:hypothetical protein